MKLLRLDELDVGDKFYWPHKIGIGQECYVAGPIYEMAGDIYVPWSSTLMSNDLPVSAMGKCEVLYGDLD